jgi:hypothetical protein
LNVTLQVNTAFRNRAEQLLRSATVRRAMT